MSSPSQSVVTLPELFSRILAFVDAKDHASTALVCKAWSEVILDILWYDVGFQRTLSLFKLLGPVVKASNGLWVFMRPLSAEDWSRFDKYAMRVRKLDCRPVFMDQVDLSFWLEISSNKPRQHIFPNLHTLLCTPPPSIISILAPSHVKSLSLFGYGTHFNARNFVWSLFNVQPRMKSLRTLSLFINTSEFQMLHPRLAEALCSFSYIHHLSISQEYLTREVTNVLASFPHLKTLEGWQLKSKVIQTRMLPPSLEEGSFPSLTSLHVYVPFSDIVPCLSRLVRLTTLDLTSIGAESTDAYVQAIQAIASALPALESLELKPNGSSLPPSNDHHHVQFSALSPVLSLCKLRVLTLHHYHPFDVDCDNLISLLQGLPKLKALQLNPSPRYLCNCVPTLDGTSLLMIAPHCQRLGTLGLYMDTSTLPTYDEAVSLPSLVNFTYGPLRLSSDNMVPIATFLSRLLPEGCHLIAEWWQDHDDETVDRKSWDEVLQLLPAFRRVRQEERRLTALEFHRLNISL